MRERLRRDLLHHHALAKKHATDKDTGVPIAALQPEEFASLEELSAASKRALSTERELYVFQKEKEAEMRRLHRDLQHIDAGERLEPVHDAYVLTYENGEFFLDPRQPVTFGDIIIGPAWGVEYDLPPNVPRELRKRYILERARTAIHGLADKQIAMAATRSLSRDGRRPLSDIYSAAARQQDAILPRTRGLLAEKLARTLMQKLLIDAKSHFSVENSDRHEDIEEATDFFIRAGARRWRIQFTIGNDARKLTKKRTRVARNAKFNPDEPLTVVPVDMYSALPEIVRHWRRHGAGYSPTRFIPPRLQEAIAHGVLSAIPGSGTADESVADIIASEAHRSSVFRSGPFTLMTPPRTRRELDERSVIDRVFPGHRKRAYDALGASRAPHSTLELRSSAKDIAQLLVGEDALLREHPVLCTDVSIPFELFLALGARGIIYAGPTIPRDHVLKMIRARQRVDTIGVRDSARDTGNSIEFMFDAGNGSEPVVISFIRGWAGSEYALQQARIRYQDSALKMAHLPDSIGLSTGISDELSSPDDPEMQVRLAPNGLILLPSRRALRLLLGDRAFYALSRDKHQEMLLHRLQDIHPGFDIHPIGFATGGLSPFMLLRHREADKQGA